MLDDEGAFGVVHIGVGTNITLGGVIKAKTHYDLLMYKPTLIIDGKEILKDGNLVMKGEPKKAQKRKKTQKRKKR